MSIGGIVTFMQQCPGQVLNGDGIRCVTGANIVNLVVLLAVVGWIIWYVRKNKKGPMNKSFGSFVGK